MNKEKDNKLNAFGKSGGFSKFKKFELPKTSQITVDGSFKLNDEKIVTNDLKKSEDLIKEKKLEVDTVKKLNKSKKRLKNSIPVKRKFRPIQISAFVTKITEERMNLLSQLENNRKKSNIIEQAIEEYQKKYHPNLVLENREWNLLF